MIRYGSAPAAGGNQSQTLSLRHLILLALVMACAFLIVGQLYLIIPLTDAIASFYGVVPARAALAGTVFGIAYGAGFLVFGPLSDRTGRRRVMVLGLLAMALATALAGIVPTFDLLLWARAAQGFVAAAFPPAALSLVTEALPPRHRALGVSLVSFAFLVAAPLAQFLAAQTTGSLAGVMLSLAPLYLLGAGGLYLAATVEGPDARPRVASQSRRGGFGELLGYPSILSAWASATTVLFGFVCFHAGAQAFAAHIHIDLQALRLIGLPLLLLAFAAAPLTRRFGAPVTASIGLLLGGLALGLALVATPSAVMAASGLLSGGVALAVPGLIGTIAGHAPQARRGLALALYSFFLFVGASAAPTVVQVLTPFGLVPLWLLPGAMFVLAAACMAVFTRGR